ncbi:MAG: beta-lactamase family protein [Pirellulales bacterium]|nr:beta-lactamase family protein [Pirellulales bacterium]
MFFPRALSLVFSLLIVASSPISHADDAVPESKSLAPARAAAVDAAVRAEMERQQLVGVAVGVIEDGQIVYLQGYGLADAENRTPATAETVFNWASNSKPLAAVLAMQLVEQGRLDLDADVRKYVPEFPDKSVKITCRHLLTHQSGILHYANGTLIPTKRKYGNSKPWADPVLALDRFNQSPLLFAPGERNSYSSYAYILLSAVIQRAAKTPFTELVEAKVAKPLGLRSFQRDTKDIKPEWTTGYERKGGKVAPSPDEANDWKHGAGAYKSNVRDFARWAQALMNRELVSEATEKIIWEPQKLSDGSPSKYGLGFVVEAGKRLKVSHNGQQSETTTRMVIFPREKHGVVVMCNCDFAKIGKLSAAVYAALGKTEE